MLQLAQELHAEWMVSKEPPWVYLPFTNAEECRRMTGMMKAQCKHNKTCKCLKCRDAVYGKCTAKVLNVSVCLILYLI